ncbi:MAG: DUF5682 family protein [Saprospiraceae bacterium]|nr:DUF5682 family protein [Saprospiraceae bacterium]
MNLSSDLRIFGIRHHGPGSARRLLEALHHWKPDCILIECPADGQAALDLIGDPGLVPPLALLIYSPQRPGNAAHLPFARFSPEWLAARYATSRKVPVIAMDLPWGIQDQLPDQIPGQRRKDPFAIVATHMGYTDTERWWEYYFEQVHGDEDLFPAIAGLMSEIRNEMDDADDPELQMREAWMRRTMREYQARGYQRIAVVCGAYHVPGLNLKDFDAVTDQALVQQVAAFPTASTWVPWTYHNLATQSGYGAGVLSPAWYDLLFEHRDRTTIHWMTRTAQLLRSKDHTVPPASVPASVEMAEALATLRNMHQPGFVELEEAALATMAHGDLSWLEVIRDKNLIGDRMGKVPDTIPQTPLQEDFHTTVRSARLKRALETPEKVLLDLDLRKKTNALASILLHRLILLNLPWGVLRSAGDRVKGSFRERWTLQWKKLFGMRLLEAGLWGLTLPEAAHRYTIHRAEETVDMAPVSQWLRECLSADLPHTSARLAQILMARVAESVDILDLMKTLTPLVYVTQYGERKPAVQEELLTLIDRLMIRIRVGLASSLLGLSDEQAMEMPGRIRQLTVDMQLLKDQEEKKNIFQILVNAIESDGIHPYLGGALARFLLEEGIWTSDQFVRHLREQLQGEPDMMKASSWCSGLLTGSEALLLHQPDLWQAIDAWVAAIPEASFTTVLPILRRTFTGYSVGSKRQIAILIKQRRGAGSTRISEPFILEDAFRDTVLPVLHRWIFPSKV